MKGLLFYLYTALILRQKKLSDRQVLEPLTIGLLGNPYFILASTF